MRTEQAGVESILKKATWNVYAACIGGAFRAGCTAIIARRPAAAARLPFLLQRERRFIIERLNDRIAAGIHSAQQLDLALRTVEQAVTLLEQFHAFFVLLHGIGQAQLTFFQLVDDSLQARQCILEGQLLLLVAR